jgi:hypothetical protein
MKKENEQRPPFPFFQTAVVCTVINTFLDKENQIDKNRAYSSKCVLHSEESGAFSLENTTLFSEPALFSQEYKAFFSEYVRYSEESGPYFSKSGSYF